MAGKCEDCTFCCKMPAIKEFNKPRNVWCQFCAKGKGCTIYDSRPASCIEFECVWLQSQASSQAMSASCRPDKSHVMLVVGLDNKTVVAHCDPAYPLAWREGPVHEALKALLKYKHNVVVNIKNRFFQLMPDGEQRDIVMSEPDANGNQWFRGYKGE